MRKVLVGFRTDSMRALFGEATAQLTKRVYDRLRNIIKTNQRDPLATRFLQWQQHWHGTSVSLATHCKVLGPFLMYSVLRGKSG